MDAVVAPVLHKYEEPVLACNVTLPPLQKVVGPVGVMVATGNGLTLTVVIVETDEQLFPFVIDTV